MTTIELPELIGSEKQIRWATEIREKFLQEFSFEELENNRKQFKENEEKMDKLEEEYERTNDEELDDILDELDDIQFRLRNKIKYDTVIENCFLNETNAAFYIENRHSLKSLKEKYENK